MAGDVDELARWWTSASQEEKNALWQKAIHGGPPSFDALRIAIYISEIEAGQVTEG